jgi:glycosyltransferase involved in cell wall biosynthesis
MAKILWVGDSPTVDTGFGIVTNNILKELKKYGHEIVVLGINTFGDPYDQRLYPYKIYPCQPGGTEQLYGLSKLWPIVEFEQPDLLFFLNDPWLIEDYLKRKPKNYPYMKTMAYFPTDAGPIKPQWVEMLSEFDAQVCYSKYAERTIIESNGGKRPKNLYQVYHGVETDIFKPLNQALARTQLELNPKDFIVGMVARNQFRKRFDLLAQGFAEFAKDKEDAKLYLHTSLHDVGFDIVDLAHQLDIADKLILTSDVTAAKGVSKEELNIIYNSFDVNALISLGDGFGLPVAESMAVGCPQIVSDHSCLKELVEGHGGFTVKNAAWILHTSGINTWGGVSDITDIAAKLQLLYNSVDLRVKLSEDAYKFINQPQFTWEYAGERFNEIIRSLFHIL